MNQDAAVQRAVLDHWLTDLRGSVPGVRCLLERADSLLAILVEVGESARLHEPARRRTPAALAHLEEPHLLGISNASYGYLE